jgi:sensor histidine kinase regulating citrate/malate metabolism
MFKTFFLDTSKLSKEDFQNVIVNHTKNSFEADAETIIFKFVLAENKFLVIDLIDDGKGIPKSIINSVYELDFSTKTGESGSRGIGLYLCREILRNAGGDDRIFETSKNGTTIELKIPIL